MFHVERCPVDPASATKRTVLNQLMNTRIDDLHREGLGERSEGSGEFSLDLGDRRLPPGHLDAQRGWTAGSSVGSVRPNTTNLDSSCVIRRSELRVRNDRPGQQEDGLEQ